MLIVHGAKAGQAQQKPPTIAADTVASISKIKILYILSEGEIKGLANGAASIMLDGTPLVDPQGVANFKGVEWEMRHGTPDQTHIPGLTAVSNEIGINTAVRSGTPWVRAVTDIELDSVNVNVSWARLSATTEKFDVIATTVAYAIDVQTDGGGYVTVLDTSIKAKTSGRYQRTHNIKLPRASTGWQIRVRKITADGDNEKLFNAMQVDTIAEIVDVKLRYPNSALLYLSYNAQTFSNIPKLSVAALGRYVQIPTNYNEVTRKSIGLWDGTFKQGYTNNPAWILYDLITNDRYGLGDKLKPFMINKWALENIARICDQEVSDGKGGTEPRHTCNLYLQQAEDAYRVIQHISGIFRGLSFWDGSQIIIEADGPRDTDYVLTRANVIDGMFIKTGTPGADRHTIAKVAFSDPNNAYATDYVMVRNEAAIAQYGINVIEMAAVGCTSEGQAYRMGLAALLTEQNRTQTVTFSMGLEGALPTVGSRVDISDPMFTGKNTGGRISSVSADRKVITLDRDGVPAAPGDRLIVNLENGKAQARVISAVKGRAITVVAAFDAVASENVWTVDSATMPVMPFIVLSVTGNEDMTQYSYVALQYDPGLHSQIDNGTLIDNRPPIPTDSFYNIAAPATMAITSRERVDQGQRITTLVLTWAQVPGAVSYNVQWRKDGGDWITLTPTGNISAEIDGVYAGNYTARVSAIGAMGQVSKYTDAASKTINGRAGTPAGLISFTAAGLLFGTRLNWAFGPTSGDAAYVEIEIGTSPGANVSVLGLIAHPTTVHEITGMAGGITRAYRGRIVDRLGNKSPWSEWVTATSDDSTDAILELLNGEITSSQLDQDLRTKIDLSGTNAADISGVKADIAAANAAIDKAKADILATDGILATAKGELDTAKADITKAKTDITAAKSVADLAKADSEANKTVIAELTTIVGNNKTSVDSVITNLTTKDLALSNLYTALKSEYDNNKASVSQDLTALTNKDISLSSLLTALDTDYQGNKTAIRNELTAVSTKTDSTANSLNSLTTEVGKNKTAITTEATTRSTEDTALSNRITAISGKTDNALSRITTAETTIANNTGAITQQKTDITAAYKKAIDDIEVGGRNLLENSKEFNLTAATATLINYSRTAEGYAKIEALPNNGNYIAGFMNFTNFSNAVNKFEIGDNLTISLEVMTDKDLDISGISFYGIGQAGYLPFYGQLKANVFNTISYTFKTDSKICSPHLGFAYASGIFYIRSFKIEKGNKATDWTAAPEDVEANITAAITRESTARTSAVEAVANTVTALDTRFEGNKTSVSNALTVLTNKDTSLANSITALTTTVGNNTTAITTETTARSTADTALGNRITTVEGKTDNALARVSTVETAVATNTGAIASQTSQVSAALRATKVLDTRYENQPPSYYWANHEMSVVKEFKFSSVMGIGIGNYLYLDTLVKWSDSSGGAINQTAVTDANVTFTRISNGTTAWTAWVQQENEYSTASKISAAVQIESTARADALTGLYAQYTVKLDVGGRVSGFGLASSATQSDFAVNADKFYIAPPTGTAKGTSPFMVLTTATTINGTSVPAGTYIEAAFIHNGSIDTAKIKDLSVNTAKIALLAVKSAQIDNLAVTTGKIANLAVDTLQIAGRAITVPRAVFIPTAFSSSSTDTPRPWVELNTVTGVGGSGFVTITISIERWWTTSASQNWDGSALRVLKNNAVIRTWSIPRDVPNGQTATFNHTLLYLEHLDETGSTGDYRFEIMGYRLNLSNVLISLTEVKR